VKKKKSRRTWFWLVLFCGIVILGGFYVKSRIGTSKRSAYASKAVSPSPGTTDRIPSQTASPKPSTVSSIKGKFTFFPDHKNRYAWSVKYPDGRTFRLGDEFSSDCPPIVGRAAVPATIRFELSQQRSCKAGIRKSVQVAAESLKEVAADGSPEIIATILMGGNIYGHTSSLISLTPTGPKVVRRLD